MNPAGLGWSAFLRFGLVQASLGAIVVLVTSTFNRVMAVEYALPATVPGLLFALHYVIQVSRPGFGHGSDVGGSRTRWIVGGMAVLALGGTGAAVATTWIGTHPRAWLPLAILAYSLIGIGVGAAGTSLLAMMAKRVAPEKRAAVATTMWIMMIAGFALTSGVAGHFLTPYSPQRLVDVAACVSLIAFCTAALAVRGLERDDPRAVTRDDGETRGADADAAAARDAAPAVPFRVAFVRIWAETPARRFTIFVFVSMLAYSMQDLILEPFAGVVFALTPGQTTQLSGVNHAGSLLGMLTVAFACSVLGRRRVGTLRAWMIGGCLASGAAQLGLAFVGASGAGSALPYVVFALGLANGAFAIAAIASMMELAGKPHDGREGMRMGLWGAAQAVAFGLGGLAGTAVADLARLAFATPGFAYALVFASEAVLFVAAARLAARLGRERMPRLDHTAALTGGRRMEARTR